MANPRKRTPKPCVTCGNPFSSRGKYFCSRVCAGTKTHRQTASPEHGAWRVMHDRCRNPRSKDYPRYGGKGVKVCERWNSFEFFIDDMGWRPGPEYSLDRIDGDKDYDPSNCRWATRLEQSRNRAYSWQPEQDRKLAQLLADGFTHEAIAPLVGRSRESVSARAHRLGLRSRRTSGGRLIATL